MVDMMIKGLKLCRSVALSIHNFLQLQKTSCRSAREAPGLQLQNATTSLNQVRIFLWLGQLMCA